MIKFQAVKPDIVKAVKALETDALTKIELVAQAVGAETIAYLRSLTSEIRPPARRPSGVMTGPRRAHPGHWADVTSQLANSYWFEVSKSEAGVILAIGNHAEYAIWLEVRQGFFVVKGVAEPGGPVSRAMAKVVPQIAPGWVVQGLSSSPA